MDLGDLANTVQDCGLSQTIKTGLNKGLMKPPAWGTPEEEEAKKGQLKGCNPWKVYNTAMGAACMGAWASKDNVVLGTMQAGGRRRSSVRRPSAEIGGPNAPPTEDSIKFHWEAFSNSSQFALLAKYQCLEDNICKTKCISGHFEEMRPLGASQPSARRSPSPSPSPRARSRPARRRTRHVRPPTQARH